MGKRVELEEVVVGLLAKSSGAPLSDMTMETPLGATGLGLDSIAHLELLLAIETSTGLRLRSETLVGDALFTIGSLVDYVASLKDG